MGDRGNQGQRSVAGVLLAGDLRRAMVDEDVRKVDAWTARYHLAVAEFAIDPVDPFFNANRPDDLTEAERLLARAQTTGDHRTCQGQSNA